MFNLVNGKLVEMSDAEKQERTQEIAASKARAEETSKTLDQLIDEKIEAKIGKK